MRKARQIMILGTAILLWHLPGFALYEYQVDQKIPPDGQYESGVTTKLARGVTNVLFGWTEIMRTPVRISADPRHGALYSSSVGVPLGIFRFAGRTLVGVYEMVTCLAPQPPIFEPIEGDVL